MQYYNRNNIYIANNNDAMLLITQFILIEWTIAINSNLGIVTVSQSTTNLSKLNTELFTVTQCLNLGLVNSTVFHLCTGNTIDTIHTHGLETNHVRVLLSIQTAVLF